MKIMIAKAQLLLTCIMIIGLMFIVNSSADIDLDSCVGMWLFNESDGNTAKDSSGKDNHGTIHGGAKRVNGKLGRGLSLDGTDDYVEVPHDDTLMVGGEHTIALWFKLASVPGGGMGVVTKDDWAPGFWWDGSIIRHHTHDPPATLHYVDAAWKPDTEWHHVAATWDGEKFDIYLDANSIGSGVNGANLGRNALTDKPLLFGIYLATGQHDKWGAFLGAIIDEVVIFNTALSKNDIGTIMNDGLETVADIEPLGKLTTTWAAIKDH